ncbi:MAG: hypothetical protein ABW252_12475, partial [Polyangiales bacterium]
MSTKATKKPTASGGTSERKSAPLKDAVNTSGAAALAAPASDVRSRAEEPRASTTAVDNAKDSRREPIKAPTAVQALAQELITANDAQAVLRHALGLEDEREATANQAARLVHELAEAKPELLVPLIERFGRLLISKNRRVVASAASALAPLSRIAPAKVAKQLPVLTQNWEHTSDEGKDGLVRTFAGLCTASVAYQ